MINRHQPEITYKLNNYAKTTKQKTDCRLLSGSFYTQNAA